MLAQPAIQGGRAVAANILRDLAGKPMRSFAYKDPGTMATVGRNAGVAPIRGIHLNYFFCDRPIRFIIGSR
jgi:NADH dehydrogenase